MSRSSSTIFALSAAALICFVEVPRAEGHCWQMKPVSRQFFRTREFNDGSEHDIEKHADAYNGGGPVVLKERTYERMDPDLLEYYGGGEVWPVAAAWDLGERCPNGNYLENDEIAVNHGVCGDTPQSGDDNPIVYSTPNKDWPILEEYTAGQTIEISLVFTNYHWGHVEFFLCDTGDLDDPDGVVTQSCFNKYPLDRASDDSFNSPVDPDYPGRYYIDPPCRGETGETDQTRPELGGVLDDGQVLHMRYVLPDITCSHCVLQMAYHSGTGCKSPGYDEFDPPSWPSKCAPNKEDWIAVNSAECRKSGAKYGNVFWQCADVTITSGSGGGPTPTPPTPTPPSATPTSSSGHKYLGCYSDAGNMDRMMTFKEASGDMTTEMCEKTCAGEKFFGTQYGEECWCGDAQTDHLVHGESEECDFPCSGDADQLCGGYWSMNVYEYE